MIQRRGKGTLTAGLGNIKSGEVMMMKSKAVDIFRFSTQAVSKGVGIIRWRIDYYDLMASTSEIKDSF